MFDFWGTFWSTVLALLCVAAVSSVAAWIVRTVARHSDRRPDFLLERQGDGQWLLRRSRRRIAYDVAYGSGRAGSSSNVREVAVMTLRSSATNALGDMLGGQSTTFPVGKDGEERWFVWIDRDRLFSKTLVLTGAGPIPVRRRRVTKDGRASTG